jgi:DNA mismatch repair ATPase MutS
MHYQDVFAENYPTWKRAAEFVAELDALLSLAAVSNISRGGLQTVRPKFLQTSDHPTLNVKGMWHPFVPEK